MNRMHFNSKTNPMAATSIDELLESESQQMVMRTVKALPDDVPSMAWRGSLNEALVAASARQRTRRRVWLFARPSFGVVAAAALCFALFMPGRHRPQPVAQPKAAVGVSLEDQLVASHSDSVTSQDVVGAGLSNAEVQQATDDTPSQDTPTS